jgi:uncharacterized protein YegL
MSAPTTAPIAPVSAPPTAAAHIWFLLDRSGSMQPLAAAVVDGFNEFIAEQQNMLAVDATASARLTLAQFDGAAPYEELIDGRRLDKVGTLAHAAFAPRGSTPLYDAMGHLLDRADQRVAKRTAKAKPAESQLVVVFTDGHENASQTWTRQAIFDRIATRKARGWTFVFLGANQDSYATGGGLAMDAGSVSNYAPSPAGVSTAWKSVSRSMSRYLLQDEPARAAAADDFFGGTKEAESGT